MTRQTSMARQDKCCKTRMKIWTTNLYSRKVCKYIALLRLSKTFNCAYQKYLQLHLPSLSFTLSAFFSCLYLFLALFVLFSLFFVLLFGHPCYLIAADEGAVAVSSSLGFLSHAATLSCCSNTKNKNKK